MKNLMNLMLIAAMVFAFSACGKKEESSSSSASVPVVNPLPTTDFYGSESTEFGNFDTLKQYFLAKTFDNGVSAGQIIYHVGPEYGMQTSGGNFNLGFCIVFFGQTIGDCDDMGNNAILENIVANGEYKVVTSANASGVSYDLATDVVDGQFVFEARNFDQTSESFIDMLNLDNQAVIKVVVSRAQITYTDNSQVAGDLVEFFYGSGGSISNIKRIVLSKDLPLIANPVAIFDAYGNAKGALNNISNKMIRTVSAMAHNVQYNPLTGETTVVIAGTVGITLN